ncbi:hypothetical protein BXT86_01130 [candidate division WOR-3 bacterium 4484_100]|uniref:Glycosyl transferase family 1 n=1 Tax=candidate division WOR-3 bacterium 4484_100 TaxID=1936077 RepID=A0A1V4QGE3_UNCW3|nr:MAG: hypothetical protein BXT86_01130 [candidate division WOR-3 bacterium 4484_100]
MRIAFVGHKGVPARYGGVERHVEELGSRLAQRGHSIIIYSRWNYNFFKGRYKNMRIVSLPSIPQKHTEMISHTFLSLLSLLDKEVDVIHIHSVDPALLSFIPRLKAKVVVTSHGQAYRRGKWGPVAKRLSLIAERAFILFPHCRIAVSRTLKRYYEDRYQCRVVYIPNGINILEENGDDTLMHFGLSKNGYFLFVGRIIPTKGCDTLIEAFKLVKTTKKLVLVGGSSYTDSYFNDLKKRADPRVLFLGYRFGRELSQLYANAYCFVMPSEIEGLAITLLEAMAYRQCVIYSDIPENCEVAQGVGIPFRNRDIHSLAEKLTIALENPAMLKELGKKAQDRIKEEYDWDSIVTKTEQIYRGLFR